MDIFYKTQNKNEILTLLKICKESELTGKYIHIGCADYTYESIIKDNILDDYELYGIDICADDTGEWINKFPDSYNKINKTMVSLLNKNGIEYEDHSKNIIKTFHI